jgi:hypothetical protein
MPEPRVAREKSAPEQPRLAEELKKMEQEYEPLLEVEKKLIGYTLAGGVVLLVVLLAISRAIL